MKKLLILGMMVLFLSSLIAVESEPSDVVGFVKISADIGYKPFSLPFTFYDDTHTATTAVNDIIGDQLTGGNPATSDRIIDVNTNQYAFKNASSGLWQGSLTDFDPSHAYYIQIKNTATDLYIAGSVEDVIAAYGTMAIGYNAVGIPSAKNLPISDLDLVASGFTGGNPATSDRLVDVNTNQYAFLNSATGTFAGSLTQIEPGHVYYVLVKNTAFDWTFNPTVRNAIEPSNNRRITIKTNK